jgi:hypothetical protein
MIKDNNLHTDDDFDNFIKGKVDQAGHTDPNDFDIFYQKLESTGYKSAAIKTRRLYWMIIPAALIVGLSLLYVANKSTSTADKGTIVLDSNNSNSIIQQEIIKTEEENNTSNTEARHSNKTTNTPVPVSTTSTTGNVNTDQPGSDMNVQATEQTNVAKKDSALSPTVLPPAKKYPGKDSVRVRYKLEVDTVIKIDSQKVSRRKWNKNNK